VDRLSRLASTVFDLLIRPLPASAADALRRLGLRDRIFVAVAVAVACLLVLTLLFALGTLVSRFAYERRERKRADLERRFRHSIAAALAGEVDPGGIPGQVDRRARMVFVDLLMEFAEQLRGQQEEVLRELAGPFMPWVARKFATVHAELRLKVVLVLGTLGFEEHRSLIRRAVDDPSPVVAFAACGVLADRGGGDEAETILGRLPRFGIWSPRYVAEMLSRMGPGAVPALQEVYTDAEKDPATRTIAAHALCRIGMPEAAEVAEEVLDRTGAELAGVPAEGEYAGRAGDREIVVASLRILEMRGLPRQASVARELTEHPDPAIRAQALSALGALGDASDAPRVAGALEDSSRWVAVHAARALKSLCATGLLAEAAASSGDRAELCREVLGA